MPSQPATSSSKPTTLWIWPTGLYPRRVIYYLKAKALPRTVLDDLNIITIAINTQAGTLEPAANCEPRPANTSLPVLRVNNQLITQSSSILTYFEDVYCRSLSGQDPLQCAHVADIVQHINESLMWTNVYLRHKFAWTGPWTGLADEDRSSAAAENALKEWRKAMTKLEGWVRADVVEKKSKSIAGGDEPTLADFTLMATRTYLFEMYDGWNVFEGFDVLEEWFERAKGCDWYLSRDELAEIEKSESYEKLFRA